MRPASGGPRTKTGNVQPSSLPCARRGDEHSGPLPSGTARLPVTKHCPPALVPGPPVTSDPTQQPAYRKLAPWSPGPAGRFSVNINGLACSGNPRDRRVSQRLPGPKLWDTSKTGQTVTALAAGQPPGQPPPWCRPRSSLPRSRGRNAATARLVPCVSLVTNDCPVRPN